MFRSKETILEVDMKSDAGKSRELNEDYFDFCIPENGLLLQRKGQLFAVADGMGGHAAGEVASRLALERFIDAYYSDGSEENVEINLRNAVHAANDLIVSEARKSPEKKDMGSTLTAAAFVGHSVHVVHVGDSRAYLLRNRRLIQLTTDHSWVGEMYRQGALTENEARGHPMSNVITEYMGREQQLRVDLHTERLMPFDTVMLCSDGLSNALNDRQIRKVLLRYNPTKACEKLVQLANELDGSDNITTIVISVRRVKNGPFPMWDIVRNCIRSKWFKIPLILVAIGLAALIWAF